MYNTSQKWKENIYSNVQSAMNIYIDDVLINPQYIIDFSMGNTLFDKQLQLGSVASQYIEMKIHKNAGIQNPSKIRIEYGILINNALIVEEVNNMLLGNLGEVLIQSLSKDDSSFEMIPIRNI